MGTRKLNSLHKVDQVRVIQLNEQIYQRLRNHFNEFHCGPEDLCNNKVTTYDDIIIKILDFEEKNQDKSYY